MRIRCASFCAVVQRLLVPRKPDAGARAGAELLLFLMSLCLVIPFQAAAQGDAPRYSIGVFVSSDFDGCYVPGVNRAIRQLVTEEAREINSRGGLAGHPISVTFYDDEDAADKAVARMGEALGDSRMLAMIGVPSSTRGKAVFERHGSAIRDKNIPFITEISLNQMFAQFPNVFTMANAVDSEIELLKAFVTEGRFTRPAFVGLANDLYTGSIGDGLAALHPGAALVADHRIPIENYQLKTGQADAAIQDLILKKPDIVFLGLGSGAGAQFLQDLDAAGVDAPVFIVLGRITRLLGRAGNLRLERDYYQFGWDGVPNAYNERLRRRIWESRTRNWIFPDVPADITSSEWEQRGCKTREPDILSVMHDKNRRAIGRGAQYRDMLALIADAASDAPKAAGLTDLRQHIAGRISEFRQGRRVLHGWWQDWSFTPTRASAADTLIVTQQKGTSGIVLAPVQYVRVSDRLEPRPVVYISLDLISISRIDTNDKSFDADFYLSFKSPGNRIDIDSIDFTNAYRAQTGKDKLLSWRQIHEGRESTNFPKDVKLYRVSGKFTFEPELGRYPFDMQRLSISFQPSSAASPFLIQPPIAANVGAQFTIDGWDARERYVGSDQDIIPTIDRHVGEKRIVPFYKFNYTWVVTRRATDYYLRVVTPLGFILLVTYFSVFLSRSRFESTMGIQVTALLSAIALYLALPKVDSDQATLSDKVFMLTYALVSLMIGLSVLKDMAWVRRWRPIRRSVSFMQLVAFPLVTIAMITYLLFGVHFAYEWRDRLLAMVKTMSG